MRVNGAGVKSSNAGTLLDITESWQGYGDGVSTLPGMDSRGISPQFLTAAGAGIGRIFGAVSGVLAMVWYAAPGRFLLDYVSAAARVTRLGASTGPKVPLEVRWSDAQSLPIPFQRPLRSYTLLVPVRSAVAGTSAIEIGWCVNNGGLTFLGTPEGVVWSSDPAVNAGAWLPRIRRVAAGAIVNGPNSGVIPTAATWNEVGLRYTEGPTPTIEWLLDGTPRHVVSGDAAMPVLAAITSPFVPFAGINAPAGRTLTQGPARFIVQELAG